MWPVQATATETHSQAEDCARVVDMGSKDYAQTFELKNVCVCGGGLPWGNRGFATSIDPWPVVEVPPWRF